MPALQGSNALRVLRCLCNHLGAWHPLLRLCLAPLSRQRTKAARNRSLLSLPANQNTDATSNFRPPTLESILLILFLSKQQDSHLGTKLPKQPSAHLNRNSWEARGCAGDRAPSSPPARSKQITLIPGDPTGHTEPPLLAGQQHTEGLAHCPANLRLPPYPCQDMDNYSNSGHNSSV